MVCKLTLGEKGTVSIPAEALRRLGWQEGRELLLEVDKVSDKIELTPAAPPKDERPDDELTFREFLDRYAGSATGGMSTDELMQMTRGED